MERFFLKSIRRRFQDLQECFSGFIVQLQFFLGKIIRQTKFSYSNKYLPHFLEMLSFSFAFQLNYSWTSIICKTSQHELNYPQKMQKPPQGRDSFFTCSVFTSHLNAHIANTPKIKNDLSQQVTQKKLYFDYQFEYTFETVKENPQAPEQMSVFFLKHSKKHDSKTII